MTARIIYLTDEEFNIVGNHLSMGGLAFDSINLENKIIFMRDKFKETSTIESYHEGFCDGFSAIQIETLTKQEAVTKLKNEVFGLTDTGQANKWIKFFIAVGMLKVKEKEANKNYLMIKDMDGDMQKVDIAELILKLTFAGFEVKAK